MRVPMRFRPRKGISDQGYTNVELAIGMLVMAVLSAASMVGYSAFIHSSNVTTLSNYVSQIKQATTQYESTNGSNSNLSCLNLVSFGNWPANGCNPNNTFAASFPASPVVTVSPVSGQDLEFTISVTDAYFTLSDMNNLCLSFQSSDVSCTPGAGSLTVTF